MYLGEADDEWKEFGFSSVVLARRQLNKDEIRIYFRNRSKSDGCRVDVRRNSNLLP